VTAGAPEHLLFVYGSLKRDQANHAQLGSARFVGLARTRPVFSLRTIDGYPAMVPGQLSVRGELYRIATGDLKRLDEFEGTGYRRQEIELETGAQVLGYMAVAPNAGVPHPTDEWPSP